MSKGTKRILVILAFVVGLSYFTFTLVFFDPFEGSYLDGYEDTPVAIEYVVPRNVDFFVHKRFLEGDFDEDEFPVPSIWKDVSWSRDWQQFERTPLYAELSESLALGEKIDEIREATSQVPMLEPLADLLGRDSAIFGRVKGRGFDETHVAAVFLGSMSARFAYEAAGNGLVRSTLGLPLEVEDVGDGVRKISLESGTDLYGYREKDLFVISTGNQLATEVRDLLINGREESLGFSSKYHTTVAQDVEDFAGMRPKKVTAPEDLDRRIQLHGSLPAWFADSEWDDDFRDPRGEISRWLMARLFNPGYFDEMTLDIGIGEILELRGMLGFDRDRAESANTGFYKNHTFDLGDTMDRVAKMVPEDTYLLVAARVDMNRFLPTVIQALSTVDPKARELLDGVIKDIRRLRPDFRAQNSDDMARSLAGFLGDDVVIALRRDTYFGPPDDPTPIVGLYFQVTDRGPKMKTLDQKGGGDPSLHHGYNGFIYPIMKANTSLKNQGRGVTKWYNVTHPTKDGQEHVVQDIILSGTDIKDVAFGIIDPPSQTKGPWTMGLMMSSRFITRQNEAGQDEHFGSAHEMLTDAIKLQPADGQAVSATDYSNAQGGARTVRSLYSSKKYQRGREFLDGFASAAAYVDAKAWKEVLVDGAQAKAEYEVQLDLTKVRAEIREQLMNGGFSSWRGKDIPENVEAQLSAKLDEGVNARVQEWKANDVPAARQQYLESLVWIDLIQDAFLAARVDESSQNIELRAQVGTDLD